MQPKIYTKNEHQIQPEQIDRDALYVVAKLRQAGYAAYIVGGSVRDLLMGHPPKDFDISTSAKPEEVKRLFSHCLLIGRRFRLAHVRFGKKVIEVATFRSGEIDNSELIIRDNIWGTPEEDVLRRDFTINGLCYDPGEDVVIDYVGGWEDLKKHCLRTIGKAETRFKQDPVRMIRLIKFRARFEFNIDPEASEALQSCKEEIHKSSPARVLEELFRMLESGSSARFFQLLYESGFLRILLPRLDQFMQSDNRDQIFAHLNAADMAIKQNKHLFISRSILASSLLFPPLQSIIETHSQSRPEPVNYGEIVDHTHEWLREVLTSSFSAFPKRMRSSIDFILHSQYRLCPLSTKRPPRLRIMKHPDFPLSLQFLQLRCEIEPALKEHLYFWKKMMRHKHKAPKPESDEAELQEPQVIEEE